MFAHRRGAVSIIAALALSSAAAAGEDEIMAHYDAYDAAFSLGRLDEADAEGEAAWRAAEEEWGAREETAVLAFNLARLRLIQDRREPAIEPALRVMELVESGTAGGSVRAEEARLLAALAQFNADNARRAEIDQLQAAIEASDPADATGSRITWMAWSYVTKARYDRRQWQDTYQTASRATQLMLEDSSAPRQIHGAIALFGVRAAVEASQFGEALGLAHRGIAAFPPQPADRPIDQVLGTLLGWDAGLHNLMLQRGFDEAELEENYPEPDWQAGRYPSAMGCSIEWIERREPRYPTEAMMRSQVIGMLFEYYLDSDGSVIRVDPVGDVRESAGFAEASVAAMRGWRATPQPRAECRGPWHVSLFFQIG